MHIFSFLDTNFLVFNEKIHQFTHLLLVVAYRGLVEIDTPVHKYTMSLEVHEYTMSLEVHEYTLETAHGQPTGVFMRAEVTRPRKGL